MKNEIKRVTRSTKSHSLGGIAKLKRENRLKSADFWIGNLEMTPLPEEGGMYKEVYRSEESIPKSALPIRFDGSRSYSTSIYYLLKHPEFSAFHRLKQEEIWHFYEGSPLTIHVIDQDGKYFCKRLGRNIDQDETLQLVIYAGWLFAAAVDQAGSYSLIGCTVAPGFEFDDFEAPIKNKLLESYPKHAEVIQKFTRT
jgi:predicted cupin superfamily sugar epimerase